MADPAAAAMRLDVFLWYARLTKTRGAAQALAVTGRMRLDGRLVERAHVAVRVGSILTFAAGPRVRALRVEALPPRRGPAPEARACYSDLSPGIFDEAAPARSPTPPPSQYNIWEAGWGSGPVPPAQQE